MIRLELQISTFSLVAFTAAFLPLATSGLAFYLAAQEQPLLSSTKNDSSGSGGVNMAAASAATGVFLVLTALAQVSTALVLIPPTRRTLLIMLHMLPLLGAVISGIVWFGTKLSSARTAMHHVELELAVLVLWFVSTVSCTMVTTYSVMQTQFLLMHSRSDRDYVDVCYQIKEKTDQTTLQGPLTPPLREKQAYFTSPIFGGPGAGGNFGMPTSPDYNRFSTALTLKDESAALRQPASPERKTVFGPAGQTMPMSPALSGSPLRNSVQTITAGTAAAATTSAGIVAITGNSPGGYRLDSLRPSFRLHHHSGSLTTLGSATMGPTNSNSSHGKNHSVGVSTGSAESFAPLAVSKQRAQPSKGIIKVLFTNGARSFSNGTRRLSTKLLLQPSSPSKGILKSIPKAGIQDVPQLKTTFVESSISMDEQRQGHGFDEWDVNSTQLKDRLLISSLSNLDIKSASTGSRSVSRLSAAAGTGAGAQRTGSHSSSLNKAGFTSCVTPQIDLLDDEYDDAPTDLPDITDDDDDDNDDGNNDNASESDFTSPQKRRHRYLGPLFTEPPSLASTSNPTLLLHKIASAPDEILPTPVSTRSAFSFADSVLVVNGARQDIKPFSQYDKERLTRARTIEE
jgi:hypothetical protein